jgi:hypothetical protein
VPGERDWLHPGGHILRERRDQQQLQRRVQRHLDKIGCTTVLVWRAALLDRPLSYTNTSSSDQTLVCEGSSASAITEYMSGGSGDDGTVPAETTQCSQNPNLVVTVPPGGTDTDWATFHNVPWPGSAVSLTWGDVGTSPNVYPFASKPPNPGPPSSGQDWSKCQNGSCTLAIDHNRTQALITLLAATPKAQLLTALFALCNAYTYGVIRAACSVFAAVFVLFDQHRLQQELTDSDHGHGHGVYITWLTVNIHNLPGITPQK